MALVYETKDRLCGVMHWALWRPAPSPNYEVFKYMGCQPSEGIFYFRSRKNKTMIVARSMAQLSGPWFKPFVIDTKHLDEYINMMLKVQYAPQPPIWPPSNFPPDFNGA